MLNKEMRCIFFNCPRIVKIGALLRNSTVIFYVLCNNLFYVLLSFVFHLQTDFYGIHDDTDAFFLFLLLKDFDIFLKRIDAFCFFLLHKDFDTFHEPLFKAFLCFSFTYM